MTMFCSLCSYVPQAAWRPNSSNLTVILLLQLGSVVVGRSSSVKSCFDRQRTSAQYIAQSLDDGGAD